MRKIIRAILFILGLAINLFFALQCTPQSKLNRLLAKHPELLKRDTIFVLKPFVVDGFEADTTFDKYQNPALIDSAFAHIPICDTVYLPQLKKDIKKLYSEKPCFKDTLFFAYKNGLKAKLFEQKNCICLAIAQATQTHSVKVPVATTTITANKTNSYKDLFIIFVVGFLIGAGTILFTKKNK